MVLSLNTDFAPIDFEVGRGGGVGRKMIKGQVFNVEKIRKPGMKLGLTCVLSSSDMHFNLVVAS